MTSPDKPLAPLYHVSIDLKGEAWRGVAELQATLNTAIDHIEALEARADELAWAISTCGDVAEMVNRLAELNVKGDK